MRIVPSAGHEAEASAGGRNGLPPDEQDRMEVWARLGRDTQVSAVSGRFLPLAIRRGKWKQPLAPCIPISEAAVRYPFRLFRPELPQYSEAVSGSGWTYFRKPHISGMEPAKRWL